MQEEKNTVFRPVVKLTSAFIVECLSDSPPDTNLSFTWARGLVVPPCGGILLTLEPIKTCCKKGRDANVTSIINRKQFFRCCPPTHQIRLTSAEGSSRRRTGLVSLAERASHSSAVHGGLGDTVEAVRVSRVGDLHRLLYTNTPTLSYEIFVSSRTVF